VSFWSYTGAARYEDASPVERLLRRATTASDTVALSRNALHYGVYILHGADDDNVPADQARFMDEHLAAYHQDYTYHEEPGAGHWWGNRCCDWPPMFDFFAQRRRTSSADVDAIEFRTASPGVSPSSHWVTVEQQGQWMEVSAVHASLDRGQRRIALDLDNVDRARLDLATPLEPGPVTIVVNGDEQPATTWPDEGWVAVLRDGDGWRVITEPLPASAKGPARCGPFKDAFRRRMQFVYGTQGTDAENAWARAKARLDAETFWYRGNGAVDVIADVDFDATQERERSVILYGHADSNAAWEALLGDSPIQVRRGGVTVGDRPVEGDDLACLMVRPRPDSDAASVGVVAGTGVAGLRVTERLPYFVSGVAYPDFTILGADVLERDTAGVRCCGYFGSDWTLEGGEVAWSE
jgi:hypothetical protein